MKYFEIFENWLNEKNRSILSYYGSKYSLIETLEKHLPKKGSLAGVSDQV